MIQFTRWVLNSAGREPVIKISLSTRYWQKYISNNLTRPQLSLSVLRIELEKVLEHLKHKFENKCKSITKVN